MAEYFSEWLSIVEYFSVQLSIVEYVSLNYECTPIRYTDFYQPHSLAKQGDNALGSVRPSVCLSVRLFVCVLVLSKCKRGHYQPYSFVCVSVISWHMQIIARMRSIGF